MNSKRAKEIMLTEKECVSRQVVNPCNRDCANCDLVLDADEILEAYDFAIKSIDFYHSKHKDADEKQRHLRTCERCAFCENFITTIVTVKGVRKGYCRIKDKKYMDDSRFLMPPRLGSNKACMKFYKKSKDTL